MGVLLRELGLAARSILRNPGFALVAIATLALGIGANTAFFSVVDGVLLRPLPYSDPERLVRVFGVDRVNGTPGADANLSPNDVADLRADARSFDELGAVTHHSLLLKGPGELIAVRSSFATGNLFELLRTKPQLGRLFDRDDEQPGRNRVVLLSHPTWQHVFAGNPSAVGKVVLLTGVPHTVIGVLPRDFRSPIPNEKGEPEVWRPLALPAFEPGARGGHWVLGLARLKAGVGLPRAQAEMDTLTARLERIHPDTNQGQHTRLVPLREAVVSGARPTLLTLFGAVAAVLLVACANLANLTLARNTRRRRELAIHAALGASRSRLAWRLIVESLLLGTAGGIGGLLLASWAKDVLVGASSAFLPRLESVTLDGRVLAFCALVSIATGAAVGLLPALQATHRDVGDALREAGRTGTSGPGASRLRAGLVLSQVAASMFLLVTAGLLVRSLSQLLDVHSGFETARLLSLDVKLPRDPYPDTKAVAFFTSLAERATALPGVSAAGVTSILPLSGGNSCDGFAIAEQARPAPGEEPCAEVRASGPGYFEALGVVLRRGRAIEPSDAAAAPRVAVVSESFAARFLPGKDALARHIVYSGETWAIVGVFRDLRHFGPAEPPVPEFHVPFAQLPDRSMTLVARGAAADPRALATPLRRLLRELDPDLAPINVRSLEDLASAAVAPPRLRALLLSGFAAAALLLGALGLYGVLSCGVAQRGRELGIRLALGALPRDIARMVVGEGMRLVAAGIALGGISALAVARGARSLLFGVGPADPMAFGAAGLVLAIAALAACLPPGRRASRVDPMLALRDE